MRSGPPGGTARDAQWTQTFLSRPMTRRQFEDALAEAGLKVDRYLTEDRIWVRAVAADAP
ncbi:hypothetical protein Sgou_20940 [Streptomyces gougerotii]|uniref:Methyltransferase n=3 Tax=Streptomyces TaxID=1883 RepID=A0A8H9HSP8_9ACTN|nr:Methyltransferase [Streptomyces griseus]GFH64968.1 hypothetical protein Srut_14820 [Streptomyces rutgersensis]GFH70564.1 hypothetical protein Sdia_13320 [Streptomyces diastaticus subsp. diastaticus]GFH77424.1 hypothetical protein Sgou_20940 [Streptomyces gougerotii]GGU34920.1 hypothetical protein GCM10015534_41860 [Streptomyces diastaticus subsp. diastaticus]